MTGEELSMLVARINDMNLQEGTVLKADGQWHVGGKPAEVPAPIIKMPYWTEGTKAVVIDQLKEDK